NAFRPLSTAAQPSLAAAPARAPKRSALLGNDHAMQSVYEAAGGDDGLLRLAEAWHARVMADEVVAHAFSHGFHPQHVERLAAYWAEAVGGPSTYSDSYGEETTVVKMHSGNGEHEEMDGRAIAYGALRRVLHDYFAWATTTTMSLPPVR